MADKKRILITGVSGLIGNILGKRLSPIYEVSGIDVHPTQGLDSLVANMTDINAILPAFEDKDVVIDLAAIPDRDTSWESVHENNLPSTRNTLEASIRAGVKRVIFASSNHTTGMYERDKPYSKIVKGRYEDLDPEKIQKITVNSAIRPDGPYGIGKSFGEAIGRYYSDEFGLSVLCLRIGSLNKESCPLEPRHFATLLTHCDLVHLVEKCIQAPDDLLFGIYYGVSDNKWRFWDIQNSRKDIGYRPRGNAETWR